MRLRVVGRRITSCSSMPSSVRNSSSSFKSMLPRTRSSTSSTMHRRKRFGSIGFFSFLCSALCTINRPNMLGLLLSTNQSINQSLYSTVYNYTSKQRKKEIWHAARTGNSPTKVATFKRDRNLGKNALRSIDVAHPQ